MRLAAILATAIALGPSLASAADYFPSQPEPAPGEPVGFNWGGIYGGIHAGYSDAKIDNQNVANSLASDAYRSDVALSLAQSIAYLPSNFNDQKPTYGGFLGVNYVFDDTVVGFELEYNALHPTVNGHGSYGLGKRQDNGATGYSVNYISTVSNKLIDYGVLKLRGGYIMGRFLPFFTAGLAVGRAQIRANYDSTYTEYQIVGGVPQAPYLVDTTRDSSIRKRGYVLGGEVGVGVDYAVLDNVFLRGEYTFIGFSDFNGMKAQIHNVKAGLALKY
jgi:outer membrane immunogenic protein